MKSLKTSILGLGLSGKTFHLPLIDKNPSFELISVLSRSDHPKAVKDLDHIINNPDIDLVINTLPNKFHFDITKKLLEAGKHVVVEKPFVSNIDQGKELIQLANKKDLVLSVYHNRRWDGDFLTIKGLIEKNELGDIHLFESRFDRFRPEVSENWREESKVDGGGVLYDLGPHLIDQALSLFGHPEALLAEVRTLRKNALVDDDFSLTLFYSDKRVSLSASTLIAHQTPRFQVFGSQGSYLSKHLDPQEALLKEGLNPFHPDWKKRNTSNYNDEKENLPGSYLSYYKELHNCITKNAANPVPPLQALNTIKLIHDAFESSKKRSVIPFLPLK